MKFAVVAVSPLFIGLASATTSMCGKLNGCYIRNLNDGVETKLSMTTPFTYEYMAGKSRYSVRCDVMDGKVDQIEFTMMPEGTTHRSWRPPYWIDGSKGDWVEPAKWLNSCGAKSLKVKGVTWREECFEATFPIVAMCSTDCKFDLTAAQGSASVVISPKDKTVSIDFKGAKPDTVYTIWNDFLGRASKKLSSDYPIATNPAVDISKSGPGLDRGISPTFAKTAPVYSGMRLDVNSVLTDAYGNGKFIGKLDYNLLKAGDSPVIGATLSTQGDNVIGGHWLRLYEKDIAQGASSQQLDANHVPKVVTATAQGLTIVGHFKKFTHGHMPGVGDVDHFMGFFGDFPAHCMM
jgi:hypothetical protein